MKKIILYRYKRPDGGITTSPAQPDGVVYDLRYRLLADDGKALTDGVTITACIDVSSPDGQRLTIRARMRTRLLPKTIRQLWPRWGAGMTKAELTRAVEAAKTETMDALQTMYDAMNNGQKKQIVKAQAVKTLFDRYGVSHDD